MDLTLSSPRPRTWPWTARTTTWQTVDTQKGKTNANSQSRQE